MRIAVLASGEFAVPTLQSLQHTKREIVCVITQPPRPAGRGRKSQLTPIGAYASEQAMDVWALADVNGHEIVTRLRELKIDLGVVIAFGQKLGPELIGAFRGGCVNLHASLLPRYRGAAPIQWAILRGEERTGVTVFRLTQRMDAGPILTTRSTLIKPEETTEELHDRLARIGPDAVKAALMLFEDDPDPAGTVQDDADATKAPKLAKKDGKLSFAQPAEQLARQVRGLWSWPGATALYAAADGERQERVTLVRARVAETAEPETVEPGFLGTGLHVATSDGWLEILEIRPQSGRVLSWPDFVNGRHTRPGDRFTPCGTGL